MNSYQAIEATDPARLGSTQATRVSPVQALNQANGTWSELLRWRQDKPITDQTVLIDCFDSGAPFLSVLRLWHETRLDSRLQTSENLQPQLTVYASDTHPWTVESLQLYWLGKGESQASTSPGIDCPPPQALDWLIAHWPQPTPGLHCIQLKPWACTLWLWFGEQKRGVLPLTGHLDAVWPNLDSGTQAHHQLHTLLKPSAQIDRTTASTPCVVSRPHPKALTVAVIGAGIAGSCTAKALCDQGFTVHLLDAADGPAAGASGNWVGAFHPHITRDDTPLSQLTRLGCEFSLQALESLTLQGLLERGSDWDTPGHLQTIPSEEVQRTRDTLAQLQFPDSVVQWAEPFTRMDTPLHGLFFPQGAWVKPARWVQANLAACGPRLSTHFGRQVDDLARLPDILGLEPDAVVIACAQNTMKLAGLESNRSNSVKGQITRLKKEHDLLHVASGESYAIGPPQEDWILLGATYERPVGDLTPTDASDAVNLARFQAAFPGVSVGKHLESRCAVRFVWADRLPVVGAVAKLQLNELQMNAPQANKPQVYLNTAYASRGLTWAALAAHKVAASIREQAGLCDAALDTKLTRRLNPRA